MHLEKIRLDNVLMDAPVLKEISRVVDLSEQAFFPVDICCFYLFPSSFSLV